jgi:hypothetical protein
VTRSTVLILGAGASKPYGLPLGRELRDLVLKIYANDPILRLLKQFDVTEEEFRNFKVDLQMSASPTVDAFLEERSKWMKVGKIATAIALDGKENEDVLFPPKQPLDHWYEALWHRLPNTSWTALKRTSVRVISFNYDRTLECYLCGVISNNFRISRAKAASWLSEEFVIHPHGTLGPYHGERLHWLSTDRPERYMRVKAALSSIAVISEAKPQTSAFREARTLIKNAAAGIFLGFGYHPRNMTRLGFPNICEDGAKEISASHRGIQKTDWSQICRSYFCDPTIARDSWPSLSRIISKRVLNG